MNKRFLQTIIFTVAFSSSVQAQSVDGKDIIAAYNLTEEQQKSLEDGNVLAFDGEQYERSPRELASDATVLVNQPMSAILESITDVPTIIPDKYVVEYSEIESIADLADIAFLPEDYDEADDLLKAKAGKKFNLSPDELAMLAQRNKAAKSREDRLASANVALREILTNRYDSYMAQGLKGIPVYQRSKKKAINIGEELTLTTETFEPFALTFEDFYGVMHDFPEGADCCRHILRWLKVELRDRPTFALAHTIIQAADDYLLVTERHYYVTNTLNSVQITVSWVPYDEDTNMGLAISASTDVLDSFMGRMLRGVGRDKAKDLVSDTLTQIRAELEEAHDEAAAE